MTVESTRHKRTNYAEAGPHACPKCQDAQACWHSARGNYPVALICQRCGSVWVDQEATEIARKTIWDREEKELKRKP